jgi:hypothetical protein
LENYVSPQLYKKNNDDYDDGNIPILILDGASVHFAHIARQNMNVNFPGQGFRSGGKIA